MSNANEIIAKVKLQLKAGKATPAPPVGPALGQYSLNLKKFCDDFNEKTKDKMGYIIPVELLVYKNKSFDMILKTPPVSDLVRKAISVDKGASNSKTEKVGVLEKGKLDEIAKMKLQDLNTVSLDSARKMIKGTARSMGVSVEE